MLFVFPYLIANFLGKQRSISYERKDNSSTASVLQPLALLRKSNWTLDVNFG